MRVWPPRTKRKKMGQKGEAGPSNTADNVSRMRAEKSPFDLVTKGPL